MHTASFLSQVLPALRPWLGCRDARQRCCKVSLTCGPPGSPIPRRLRSLMKPPPAVGHCIFLLCPWFWVIKPVAVSGSAHNCLLLPWPASLQRNGMSIVIHQMSNRMRLERSVPQYVQKMNVFDSLTWHLTPAKCTNSYVYDGLPLYLVSSFEPRSATPTFTLSRPFSCHSNDMMTFL